MNKVLRPEEPEVIDCDICLSQIPGDSSVNVESADYVLHFCGLACYEKWKSQGKTGSQESDS